MASLLGLGTCPAPCCFPSVPGLVGFTLPCVNLGTCGGQRPHRYALEEPCGSAGHASESFFFFFSLSSQAVF